MKAVERAAPQQIKVDNLVKKVMHLNKNDLKKMTQVKVTLPKYKDAHHFFSDFAKTGVDPWKNLFASIPNLDWSWSRKVVTTTRCNDIKNPKEREKCNNKGRAAQAAGKCKCNYQTRVCTCTK